MHRATTPHQSVRKAGPAAAAHQSTGGMARPSAHSACSRRSETQPWGDCCASVSATGPLPHRRHPRDRHRRRPVARSPRMSGVRSNAPLARRSMTSASTPMRGAPARSRPRRGSALGPAGRAALPLAATAGAMARRRNRTVTAVPWGLRVRRPAAAAAAGRRYARALLPRRGASRSASRGCGARGS
jgi:hypothetical protein